MKRDLNIEKIAEQLTAEHGAGVIVIFCDGPLVKAATRGLTPDQQRYGLCVAIQACMDADSGGHGGFDG